MRLSISPGDIGARWRPPPPPSLPTIRLSPIGCFPTAELFPPDLKCGGADAEVDRITGVILARACPADIAAIVNEALLEGGLGLGFCTVFHAQRRAGLWGIQFGGLGSGLDAR